MIYSVEKGTVCSFSIAVSCHSILDYKYYEREFNGQRTIGYFQTLGDHRHSALFLAFKSSDRNCFRNTFAWSAVGLL